MSHREIVRMKQKALIKPQYDLGAVVALAIDGLGSPGSKRCYSLALRQFLGWYAGEGYHGLSKRAVQAYKAHLQAQGYAPATVNVALSAIRRLALEAADNGLLSERVAAAIRRVGNVRAEVVPAGRDIAPGELVGLMRACADDHSPAGVRDAALIGLLYVTGMRRAEAVALALVDYVPESGAVTIRKGKGNKQRVVYITNGATEALGDWLRVRGDDPGALFCPVNKGGRVAVRQMTGQSVRRMLEKRAGAAGIDALTPHDFRRTTVGDLLDAGADIVTVQKILGHASPTTTARYDRRPEETKKRAAGMLHLPYFKRDEQIPLGL